MQILVRNYGTFKSIKFVSFYFSFSRDSLECMRKYFKFVINQIKEDYLMSKRVTNSQKSIFFENFYHLQTYEGLSNVEKAIRIAASDAGLSIESELMTLQEIENQNETALVMTEDSAVVIWFKVNAGLLAKFIQQSVLN